MTMPEQRYFATFAELEFTAGCARISDKTAVLSAFSLHQAQDFDTVTGALRDVLRGQSVVAQAALPATLVDLDAHAATDGAALPAAVAQAAGLRADELMVVLVDGRTGLPLTAPSPTAHPLAACFNRRDCSSRRAALSIIAPGQRSISSRYLNTIAAIKTRLLDGTIDKPVLYVDLQPGFADAAWLTQDAITPLPRLGSGVQLMLEQIMGMLGLMFKGSAARLFYGDVYDFQSHAWKLVSDLVQNLGEPLQALKATGTGAYLHLEGAPLARKGILERPLAERLELTPLQPFVGIEADGVPLPAYFAPASLDLWHLLVADKAAVADVGGAMMDWPGLVQQCRDAATSPAKMYRGQIYGRTTPHPPPVKVAQATVIKEADSKPLPPTPRKRIFRGQAY